MYGQLSERKIKTMLNYASCEVSILVNGNSVKTHLKDGKTYIEAKDGSEYEIHIKNHGCGRALVVASVDGLNVLTGESASTLDSGYVVNGYSDFKIKGFRYNNDKVGAFKFVKKTKSYASGKQDGSEANCGIIGVAIYNEDLPPNTWTVTSYRWPQPLKNPEPSPYDWTLTGDPVNSNFYSTTDSHGLYDVGVKKSFSTVDMTNMVAATTSNNTSINSLRSMNASFDMGSGWGKSKESKVVDTEFKRGVLVSSHDVYYASRDSLLGMGVIVPNTGQVSFPRSFPQYAKPPKNWVE